jgi:hypothetical protein
MEKRFLALASLPMALASFGALLDEHRALGFTIWRGACRASGFSLPSIGTFTLELLPLAVIGALLGGLIVLAGGFIHGGQNSRDSLAAHVGCAVAMPAGLVVCAAALPLPATFALEITLAGLATLGARRLLGAHQ